MSLFILNACNNTEPKAVKEDAKTTEKCMYSITTTNPVTVSWTAYKTTAKVGVGGKFTKFSFSNGKPSSNIAENMKGREFKILTDSTNTGNPERDAKIVKYFWNQMADTQMITGSVKDASGDNKAGKAIFNIRLNGVANDVEFTYAVEETKVVFDGEIDLNNWNAANAVASLNKACNDLHAGKDGISKTWPNVAIKIEAGYNKTCK